MASAPKNDPGESEDKMTEEELRELMMEADKDAPPPQGITLGDHQFYAPNQNAPMSRMFAAKKQILGMPPPSFLSGIAREATKASPAAKALYKGEFCGHGEPTMGIFDIVIDGEELLDVCAAIDPEDVDRQFNLPLLVVRKPGGDWIAIFRREWEENRSTLEGVERKPLSKKELASLNAPDEPMRMRVSIGCEYPADATSPDCVTWLTIDAMEAGQKKPGCLVDAKMA
jgi:hypothetical protein